jgi:hypothetical protein
MNEIQTIELKIRHYALKRRVKYSTAPSKTL